MVEIKTKTYEYISIQFYNNKNNINYIFLKLSDFMNNIYNYTIIPICIKIYKSKKFIFTYQTM